VKIYGAAVQALRKTERQYETQGPSKLMVFEFPTPTPPLLNGKVLFCMLLWHRV